MQMKELNCKAKEVFSKMLFRLEYGYLKLDNGSGFVPAIIEELGDIEGYGKLYSVTHYGKLNGDAMRDPDMTFVEKDGEYYAVSFRNDYLGLNQEVFTFNDDGKVIAVNYRLQYSLANFANTWMQNIKDQQGL